MKRVLIICFVAGVVLFTRVHSVHAGWFDVVMGSVFGRTGITAGDIESNYFSRRNSPTDVNTSGLIYYGSSVSVGSNGSEDVFASYGIILVTVSQFKTRFRGFDYYKNTPEYTNATLLTGDYTHFCPQFNNPPQIYYYYKTGADGSLTLDCGTDVVVGPGAKAVLFVDGSFTFKSGALRVDKTGFLAIIAKGSITVQSGYSTIGAFGNPQIQGVFITDNNFEIAPGVVNPLYIQGSVLARNNVSIKGCLLSPCVEFIYRPSFVVYAPRPIKEDEIIQEVRER